MTRWIFTPLIDIVGSYMLFMYNTEYNRLL